jgi:ATP-dependent RNA helicase DeaD
MRISRRIPYHFSALRDKVRDLMETTQQFNELPISAPLLQALNEMGFSSPTPIQAQTLPLLLGNDTDFLGLAATGTGKTAAFGIPLLERIDRSTPGVQALVLCPTRELAIQVSEQLKLLGRHLGVRTVAIYGGTGYGDQIYGLKQGAQIVIGTPGRVVDHIEKGTLRLANLRTLVLDEADEMISMGFKEDLETVLQAAPKGQANTWLFSATMGADVRSVADHYLNSPQKVQVNRTEMLSAGVEQIYYRVHEYDKPEILCKLIDAADDFYGIVFCQTKSLVSDLYQYLLGKGYRVDCLHGDLDQTSRDRVMKAFRERKIAILIATDVACRGLDVKDVTHVVNYSIPRELDNYVHRIGRTARSGKTGIAMSLVTPSHRELIGRIERMTKSKMKEGQVPTHREIVLKRILKVQTAFQAQGPQGRAAAMLPEAWKEELAGLSKEEITARFLTLMMPDAFQERAEEKKKGKPPMMDSRDEGRAPRERRGGKSARPPRHDADSHREREGRAHGGRSFSGKPKFRKTPWGETRERREAKLPPWERKGAGAPGSRWKEKRNDATPFSAREAGASEGTPHGQGQTSSLGGAFKPKKKKKKYGRFKEAEERKQNRA